MRMAVNWEQRLMLRLFVTGLHAVNYFEEVVVQEIAVLVLARLEHLIYIRVLQLFASLGQSGVQILELDLASLLGVENLQASGS